MIEVTKNESTLSLLDYCDEFQIRDIQVEKSLREAGYKFHYFIDIVDLSRYCFPFGLLREEKRSRVSNFEENLQIVSEEQISYGLLFNNLAPYTFIFDEYLTELRGLYDSIEYQRRAIDNLRERSNADIARIIMAGNWGISNEQISDINNNKEVDLSGLRLSTFYTLVTGKMKTGYDRFSDLKTKKLIITFKELKAKISQSEQFLEKWISAAQPKRVYTNELYKLWLQHYPTDRIDQKTNIYTDCKAVDRILQLNFGSQNADEKIIFLMLSSTNFFDKFPQLLREKGWLPTINGFALNPFRNVSQLYASYLFNSEQEYNALLQRNKLKKNLSFYKDDDPIKKSLSVSFQTLETFFNNRRQSIENSNILTVEDTFFSKIDQAVKSGQFNGNELEKKLQNILKLKDINKEIQGIKDVVIEQMEFDINFRFSLISGLYDINTKKSNFRIITGRDYIVGFIHLIPLQFEFNNYILSKIITAIANFCLVKKHGEKDSILLLTEISHFSEHIFEQAEPSLENKLIHCIMLLIIPEIQLDQRIIKTNDELVYEEVKEILKHFPENQERSLQLNYLHLASNISRRIGNYSEAITFAEQGLAIDSEDGRFFHDLCITYYDTFWDKFFQHEQDLDLLNCSLEKCDVALNYYRISTPDGKLQNALSIALKNTKAFLLCVKSEFFANAYQIHEVHNFLIEARKCLDEIKKYLANQEFQEFQEFLHTEAVLYLLEFQYFKNPSNLNNAIIAIDNSIALLRECNYVSSIRKVWLNEKYEILKKKIEKAAKFRTQN